MAPMFEPGRPFGTLWIDVFQSKNIYNQYRRYFCCSCVWQSVLMALPQPRPPPRTVNSRDSDTWTLAIEEDYMHPTLLLSVKTDRRKLRNHKKMMEFIETSELRYVEPRVGLGYG